jgi:hypothetical protein
MIPLLYNSLYIKPANILHIRPANILHLKLAIQSKVLKSNINKYTLNMKKCSVCKQIGHNKITCSKSGIGLGTALTLGNETYINVKQQVKIDMPILPQMDKSERVKRLEEHLDISKVKHEDQIMNLATLKEANTYCIICGLSAQQYGPLLEKFIRTKFNYSKNNAKDCTGDCSKEGKNSEVKVSLGGATHKKFNFVQIRPSHDCETYILTAYHLSPENVKTEGELYIFKVPKSDIKNLVVSYGGYAHGTINEHGIITKDSINDELSIKEYAIRPTINDECWNALLEFRVSESDL